MTGWKKALASVEGLRVRWDEPLARYTSYKIGGPADALVWADTEEQLLAVAAAAHRHGAPLMPLGRGSNMLISDEGVRGIVMKLGKAFEEIRFEGKTAAVGSAAFMSAFSKRCAQEGLSGAEFMFGIPGSVGGGVCMNAGAHGRTMSDIVVSADVLTKEGETARVDRESLGFRYRASRLGEYVCALFCHFELERGDPAEVEALTKRYYSERRSTQPLSLPSAGCAFRNPVDASNRRNGSPVASAGRLIDECGLKGLSAGGARVSEVHANFLVASPGASSSDVRRLVDEVRRRVHNRTGVRLQLEMKILDEHAELMDE